METYISNLHEEKLTFLNYKYCYLCLFAKVPTKFKDYVTYTITYSSK